MIKIAIIDDEEILANKLSDIVSDFMRKENHSFAVDIFTSGIEFTALGTAMSDYQIVCLDMKMDEMDGMEVARKIREYDQDIYIICVTAYIDFALAGYTVDALRYILKSDPVFEDTMHEALREACRKISLILNMLIFHFREGNVELSVNNITYIETNIHNAIFYVRKNSSDEYRIYTMRETLDNIEEMLSPYGFIRIHKSYLVNYRFIESVRNYKAYLSNQKVLNIPKKKFPDVKREYLLYKGRE